MAKIEQLVTNNAWVSADGSYGIGGIIVFDENLLTEEQWENLNDNVRENEKYIYVLAILNGEDLSEWED
jgi:hypothetical protein